MSPQSETGHTKNVANFETIVSFFTAYRTAYNPSKNALKPETTKVKKKVSICTIEYFAH